VWTVRVAILTVSDRSARGERPDLSGLTLRALVENRGWQVAHSAIIPDEREEIRAVLCRWCDEDLAEVILTTGGTGFAPRDVTPEATRQAVERDAPGLAEAMRAASLAATPHGMLSRGVAGIRRRTLIINLPGSPRAASESLQVVLPVLEHAIDLLRERPQAEGGHRSMQA
jgi:molybdopterin adenylyltransferase